jgi:hypothetical protein
LIGGPAIALLVLGLTRSARYVLVDSTSSTVISDGRIGASEILALVERVGTKVTSVSGLYDVHGKASELARAAECVAIAHAGSYRSLMCVTQCCNSPKRSCGHRISPESDEEVDDDSP